MTVKLCPHNDLPRYCKRCKGEPVTAPAPVQQDNPTPVPPGPSRKSFPFNLGGIPDIDDAEFKQTIEFHWGKKYDGTFHYKDAYWRSGPNAIRTSASLKRAWATLRESVPDDWTPPLPPRKANPLCPKCCGAGMILEPDPKYGFLPNGRPKQLAAYECDCAGPPRPGETHGGIIPDLSAWDSKVERAKLEAAVKAYKEKRK